MEMEAQNEYRVWYRVHMNHEVDGGNPKLPVQERRDTVDPLEDRLDSLVPTVLASNPIRLEKPVFTEHERIGIGQRNLIRK